MSNKTAFFEQFKDPRWQKKRLETLQSTSFSCEMCGDAGNTLHVHHKIYRKDRAVWDYDRSDLSVLCDRHHKKVHEKLGELRELLGAIDGPVLVDTLSQIIGFIKGAQPTHGYAPNSYEEVEGFVLGLSIGSKSHIDACSMYIKEVE